MRIFANRLRFFSNNKRIFLFIAALLILNNAGAQLTIISDGSWKASDTNTPGWEAPSFNDASWAAVTSPALNACTPVIPGTQSMWWSNSNVPEAFFRKTFTLNNEVTTANVQVTADNEFHLYVNGTFVGTGNTWSTVYSFNIQPYLTACGPNVIAIRGVEYVLGSCNLVTFMATIDTVPQQILSPSASGGTVCENGSLQLNTNSITNASSYSWTGPNGYTSSSQNPLISPIAITDSGIYTVQVSLTNNCPVAPASVHVGVNPVYSVPVSATICNGATYTLPDGTTQNASGTYTTNLTAVTGCDSVIVTTLTVSPPILSNIFSDICPGSTYTLPSGNQVSAPGTYFDTLTSVTGCDSIIMTVLSPSAPIQTNVDDTICQGSNYTLPSGLQVSNAGTYYDTLTSAGGCDSVIVTNLFVSNINLTVASTDIFCAGAPMGTITVTATGGGLPLNYQVIKAGTTVKSNTTGNFFGLYAGSYDILVTDNAGCNATGSALLTESAPVQVQYTSAAPSCIGKKDGTITPTATGGTAPHTFSATQDGSYFWYGENGVIQQLAPGTYTIYDVDDKGCSHTITAIVPDAVPDVYITTSDSTRCNGEEFKDGAVHVVGTIAQNGPFEFSIDGGARQFSGDFYNMSAGLHTVTAFNRGQCSTQLQVIVPEPPPVTAVIENDTITLALGETKQVSVSWLNASNPSFSWSPGVGLSCTDCADPVISVYSNTAYTVTVSMLNGTSTCIGTADMYVLVLPVKKPFVPNSFSPNGDGNNDVFQVYGESIRTVDLKIFNQWGELVYKTTDAFAGWDGTYKGQLQLPQVFTYDANIIYLDNTTKEEKGSVTLIR